MNKEKKSSVYLILTAFLIILIGIGVAGSLDLSITQYKEGNICPVLLGMPACYLVSGAYIICLVTLFSQRRMNINLFYTSLIFLVTLAAYGSLSEWMSWAQCPRTEGGTPMCYISLLLSGSVLILYWLRKNDYSN